MDLKNTLTRSFGKTKLTVIKHSPEILLAGGIIAGGLAIASAIKSTLKAEEIIDKHLDNMENINAAIKIAEEAPGEVDYTEDDVKKDKVRTYVHTGWAFAKLYAPTIIFTTVSLVCILSSHGIMRKRNAALAASLATIRRAYDEYRGRVIRDLGKEMDEHFLYDTVEEVREVETVDDKGKKKTVKDTVKKAQYANAYSRIFDNCNCPDEFSKDGSANYIFLRAHIFMLQDKLRANGYLFLNDVYKALGFPITLAGQSAGWIYDYDDKANTEFAVEGFDETEVNLSQAFRDLANGRENSIVLNFLNIRDSILEDIPRIDSSVAAI
jgi:hypothetical protein